MPTLRQLSASTAFGPSVSSAEALEMLPLTVRAFGTAALGGVV